MIRRPPPALASRSGLRRRLLAWYVRRRRRLPWREHPSPYRTWVSEIMLQQTQVATVLPYYRRFLRLFPNVRALARARESSVLAAWAGLGYYSRARNLRRAAKAVAARGGRFPGTLEGARALPGVGRYTAGAILSIAFNKPHAVLDGNVARVLSRLFALRGDPGTGPARDRLWRIAEALLDRRRPGDWNQALMELGALVCIPDSPRCPECPVRARCRARRLGLEDRLPGNARQRPPVDLRWTALWITDRGRVLLWKRAPEERFLPGHWGLPEARHLGLRPPPGPPLRTVRHAITHHRITAGVHAARPPGILPAPARWFPSGSLDRLLVSSLWRKCAGMPPNP